jgi:hypothetical protein
MLHVEQAVTQLTGVYGNELSSLSMPFTPVKFQFFVDAITQVDAPQK